MRQKPSKRPPLAPVVAISPEESAQAVGLHYVSDLQPGIRRQKVGRGLRYLDTYGQRISDPAVLRRIKALAIPPAWTEVWICARPDGHIQATGRDARGRKQYRYHPSWHMVRDATKYHRMIVFGEALPQLRTHLEEATALAGLPREKVLATVIRLLELTLIRVGNVEYARANRSFGLTTMRDRHVEVSRSTVQFRFRGKSGKYHTVRISDRRLATIVKRCQDLPGYELFQYIDTAGQCQTIDSADVNAYLRQLTGQDFTAKDMRTWAGTVLAARALWSCGPCNSQSEAKQQIVHAVDTVARQLGNTRAVCRKCYVHPAVLEGYLDHSLFATEIPPLAPAASPLLAGRTPEEEALLAFLKQRCTQPGALQQQAS